MAKYIINAPKYYTSKEHCSLCKAIDNQFNQILSNNINNAYTQQLIANLETCLVDGYGLEDVLLTLGIKTNAELNKILNNIKTYNQDYYNYVYKKLGFPYEKFNEYNALSSTASCMRFCKNCGSRKHDILNNREFQSLNHLKFTSIFNDAHMQIVSKLEGTLLRTDSDITIEVSELMSNQIFNDYEALSNSQYQLYYTNHTTPNIEKFKYNNQTYLLILWNKTIGNNIVLYKSLKNKDEFYNMDINNKIFSLTKDNNGCLNIYDNNNLIKKIIDDEYVSIDLSQYDFVIDIIEPNIIYDYYIAYSCIQSLQSKWIKPSIILSWDKLENYLYDYKVLLYKKAINTEYQLIQEFTDNSKLQYIDYEIADNMVYQYKLVYIDEINTEWHTLYTETIYPSEFKHIPSLPTDLYFRKHKQLLPQEDFKEHEYIYAQYTANDKDFSDICFKLHDTRVPSLQSYLNEDIVFWNHEHFTFSDKSIIYFLKPYLKSRRYEQKSYDFMGKYHDKYFWNTECNIKTLQYEPYEENILNIDFTPSTNSMIINVNTKEFATIKSFFVVFKQVNNPTDFIIDSDWEGYKVLNFEYVRNVDDYQIIINGLASNTLWVFGVFPDYNNADADIRLQYQKIFKIYPWWEEYTYYDNENVFYDISTWKLDNDFFHYHGMVKEDTTEEKVWLCENLNHMECSPLLIHENKLSEHFTVTFDYKMIAQTNKDSYHFQVNGDTLLRVVRTTDKWFHATLDAYNMPFMNLRWELMKLFNGLNACAMVKNIILHNHFTEDTETDNYTYTNEVTLKNKNYYNRVIKHDKQFKYKADKYYSLIINVNPYYTESNSFTTENFIINNNVINVGENITKKKD